MRYFPFTTDSFEHQFGIRAIAESDAIVEATEHYAREIKLKREALAFDRDYYYQALPGSDQSEQEVLGLVQDSADFIDARTNSLLREPIGDDPSPLVAISRHVQEDLTIVSGDSSTAHALVAGCVTFPSGWCIGDKIGKSILDIHQPVPEYDSVLHPPTEKLLARLKIGRPVWRTNWGVRASGQLDQSPRFADALDEDRRNITAENAGNSCFLRVERQTLARLPKSGNILFAIHTHQCVLSDLAPSQRAMLHGTLASAPEATLRYKGIWPMLAALIEHLDESSG